ncbi:MAG: ABC transporter ATP-binding protein [Candidatus Thermoplasmatota archaeon]|nr:ABC transporter ATP-binding protein [Candidatus Thermoplasmatota archaeon]
MIKIDSLNNEWKDFQLSDISFEVEENEYFVLLGPTGSGKTLLLELIAGFHRPDSGTMMVNGEDFTTLPPNERNFAFVYQDYMLFPHLNVKENIAYGLKIRDDDEIEKKVERTAEKVGIDGLLERDIQKLSGGEKQRVALARALILEPEVLLLDEPFGSLDHKTSKELRSMVKKLHSELGITTIHVTHDQEEAVVLGERVAVMKEGKIEQIDTPQRIMRKPDSRFIAEFVGTGNIFKGVAKRKENISAVQIGEVTFHSTSDLEGEVTATLRPEDIILAETSLESSARNNFSGTVKEITDRGIYQEIVVDMGVLLTVYVTRQSVEDLSLRKGKDVNVIFKASAVHLFER